MQPSSIPPFQGFTLQSVPVEDPGRPPARASEGEFADYLDDEGTEDGPPPPTNRPEDAVPIANNPPPMAAAMQAAMAVPAAGDADRLLGSSVEQGAIGAVADGSGAAFGAISNIIAGAIAEADPVAGSISMADLAAGAAQAIGPGDVWAEQAGVLAGTAGIASADDIALIAGQNRAISPTAWQEMASDAATIGLASAPPVDAQAQLQRSDLLEDGAEPSTLPPGENHWRSISQALVGNGQGAPGPTRPQLGQVGISVPPPGEAAVSLVGDADGDPGVDDLVGADGMDLNEGADIPAAAAAVIGPQNRVATPNLSAQSSEQVARVSARPSDLLTTDGKSGADTLAEKTAGPAEIEVAPSDLLPIPVEVVGLQIGPGERPWSVAQHQIMGVTRAVGAVVVEAGPFSMATGAETGFIHSSGDPSGPLADSVMAAHDVSGQISRAAVDRPGLVELTLSPEELGRIRFEIQQSGEQVRMVLAAERRETLDHLRRHLPEFLADLRQSGFSGSDISFGQWSRGSGDNSAAWGGAFQDNQPNRHGQPTNPWQRGDEAELGRPNPGSTSSRHLDLGPGRLAIRV